VAVSQRCLPIPFPHALSPIHKRDLDPWADRLVPHPGSGDPGHFKGFGLGEGMPANVFEGPTLSFEAMAHNHLPFWDGGTRV
jgi:hypothetical protein